MVLGEVDADPVPVRVHSECLTSEVLGSLKCDCRAQLDRALDLIAERGRGVLLYLRQEGRGIGLGNKIRAYALQAQGHDTYEANRLLGFPDDLRRYDAAADMLRLLAVRSVDLITNNPLKLSGLAEAGVRVRDRIQLPSREFCRQRKLTVSHFYWWQRRLGISARKGSFRKLVGSQNPASFALVTNDPTATDAGIGLVLGDGRRLRIHKGVDGETLRSVLAAMESDQC